MMNPRATTLALSLLTLVAATPVRAKLGVGDTAPPLKIKEWVQGKAVDLARDSSTKIHLVEFWATWCPPCKQSVPLLTELQTKYAKDLIIIGVTDPDDRGNSAKAVRRFVKRQGDNMNYTVAIDDGGKTTNAYLLAAGAIGIPHAFLVGRGGKIIWQGSPLEPAMTEVISAVIDGSYDLKAAKLEAEVNKRLDALGLSYQLQQWGVVWDGLIDILKIDPANNVAMEALIGIYAHELRNTRMFREWARTHIKAHRNNAKAMERLASHLLNTGDFTTRTPDLALEAAQAAHEASGQRDAAAITVYAQALYQIGALDGAIQLQENAVVAAADSQRRKLQDILDYYHQCKELRALHR